MILKVIIIGDYNVGKSSIVNQYINKTFNNKPILKPGIDYFQNKLKINNEIHHIHLYDTMGYERYSDLPNAYYMDTNICIFAYDITNETSFENIINLYNRLINESLIDKTNCLCLLVGTKIDLDTQRKVSTVIAKKWAKDNHISFCEISGKNNNTVTNAINDIIKLYINILKLDENYQDNQDNKLLIGYFYEYLCYAYYEIKYRLF